MSIFKKTLNALKRIKKDENKIWIPPPKSENNKLTFTIEGKEYEDYLRFIDKHKKCKSLAGDKISIIFIPNGIGTSTILKCLRCKKEEDITDIDCW